MKRSKYLIPLSWEHHAALVNANRVKRGLEIMAQEQIIREFIDYVWKTDLHPHFDREESVLATGADWQKVPEEFRRHMLDDHREFELLAKTIAEEDDTDRLREAMIRFSDLLDAHVRFEERQLFPAIEKVYDKTTLQRAGKELKKRHVPGCVIWKPEFWKK
ncbi:MAG TPA: hemerythrin domain-containing protein [Calditrichaeota bacterium]|nr:hemerythrin domain-containing protein [Calditrichota bacterium]